MNRPNRLRSLLLVALAFFVALLGNMSAAPAYAAYVQISGSGSTWSQVIVSQWISDVNASGIKVTYNGSGSSQGRKDFANGVTDFGISEIPYQGQDEYGNVDKSNREYAYVPIVAGGTAFTYQIKVGGKLVKNLRLSGETIAKIFTNKITNWNDPAITKDNNGHKLPSLNITPVVRSDGSGTTAQFTTWLAKQYPAIWKAFYPKGTLTSYYPKQGRTVAAAGSDQVMNTISGAAGNGTIGYVEYSYPVNAHYPVVKLLNKGGYFVEPTQYNVAVALTKAKINQNKGSLDYLTQILDGVYNSTDPRAYPLSSYSYMLIPVGNNANSRMTTAKRQTLADFMNYSLCTGQSKAGPYGYSPLPLNLVQAGFQQIARLKQADKSVDLTGRDVRKCNNPTFDGKNLSRNLLAVKAPAPASCDKVGAGPCGFATGTGTPSTNSNQSGGAAGAGGGTTSAGGAATGAGGAVTAPGAGGAATAAGGAAAVDPETGAVLADGGAIAAGGAVAGTPTELVSSRAHDTTAFGALAAAELAALVLLPGLFVAWQRRRNLAQGGGQ